MDKERQDRLLHAVELAQNMLSNKDRPNAVGEDYFIKELHCPSDDSAVCIFEGRNDTRTRLTLAYFYHLNTLDRWHYFIPTFGHVEGFQMANLFLSSIDAENKRTWGK